MRISRSSARQRALSAGSTSFIPLSTFSMCFTSSNRLRKKAADIELYTRRALIVKDWGSGKSAIPGSGLLSRTQKNARHHFLTETTPGCFQVERVMGIEPT